MASKLPSLFSLGNALRSASSRRSIGFLPARILSRSETTSSTGDEKPPLSVGDSTIPLGVGDEEPPLSVEDDKISLRLSVGDDKTPISVGDVVDGEQRTAADAQQDEQDPSVYPLSRKTSKAPAFGKLTGSLRSTLKSDVMLFFEGFNLTSDDIKVEYRAYNPISVLIRFPSHDALRRAKGLISRKGFLYRLDAIGGDQWQLTESYNGKSVIVEGIPLDATFEEVERVFHGCNFDVSNIQIFRRNLPYPRKAAVFKFPSYSEAMHACITKNHSFCRSGLVQMHVLQ